MTRNIAANWLVFQKGLTPFETKLALLTVVLFSGCGDRPTPVQSPPPTISSSGKLATKPATESTFNEVLKVVSQQFNVPVNKLTSGTSLKELHADELDLVELVMELEEQLHVNITDEVLEQLAPSAEAQHGLRDVTIQKLADLVESLK